MSKKDYVDYFIEQANKEPKHTWRCEPRIKSTLDTFAELRPECIPVGSKSSLYSGARKIVTEIGEQDAVRFVRLADQRMIEKELTVKDLHSYYWLVPEWKAGRLKDEKDLQQYVSGKYAELYED